MALIAQLPVGGHRDAATGVGRVFVLPRVLAALRTREPSDLTDVRHAAARGSSAMGAASWTAGQILVWGDTEYEIDSLLRDGRIQIRNSDTGIISAHTQEELEIEYADCRLRFISERIAAGTADLDRSLADYSQEEWTEALRKHKYVARTLDVPGTEDTLRRAIAGVHEELKDTLPPPGVSTVLKWRSAFLTNGRCVRALLPRRHRCGRHAKHWPDRVLDLVHLAIKQKYLIREQGSVEQTIIRAQGLVRKENEKHPGAEKLPKPSSGFVKRLIKQIPYDVVVKAREGSFAARSKTRQISGEAKRGELAITAPLERFEIDETQLDLMLVDDESGALLGRPYITICVDSFTRCVMGVHVSFQKPNYAAAAQCLKMAMMPKTALLKKYPEVKATFAPYGIPTILLMDNTLFYHGTQLERAIANVPGILRAEYARSKAGEDKPNVEGVQGLLNAALTKGVPGRTFSNIEERGDYDPVKEAKVGLKKFRSWLYRWIFDVYHEKPGRYVPSPVERWRASIGNTIITVPANPQEFDILMGSSDQRTLDKNGVVLEEISYYSDQFRSIRSRHGERLSVEIRYNEFDLGHIYVLRPEDNSVIVAKARDHEYAAGLSLYVHKAVRARAIETGRSDDVAGWEEALFEIQEEVEEVRAGRKPGRRRATNGKREARPSSAQARHAARLVEGGVDNRYLETPASESELAPRTVYSTPLDGPVDPAERGLIPTVVGQQTVEYEAHEDCDDDERLEEIR